MRLLQQLFLNFAILLCVFFLLAQELITGRGTKGISSHCIKLEVEAPGIPDLTLIDLPGIARVAVQGQPLDIEKKVTFCMTL